MCRRLTYGGSKVERILDVYGFKPVTEQWVKLGKLTSPRYLGDAIAIDTNRMLVIGEDNDVHVAEICTIQNDNAICERIEAVPAGKKQFIMRIP